MRTASSCIAALAISIAAVPHANAQKAEAEILFREGRKLLADGHTAEACDKFAASERLDPQIGTELNLARCLEEDGKTASAWGMYVTAEANAKHIDDPRESEARKRITSLESKLVYLTIKVPAETAVDDLVIKRNDAPIDHGEWDQPMPVDPDEYAITAEAPGYVKWSDTVTVKTKNKVIEVPPLERAGRRAKGKKPRVDVETSESPRKYGTATIALAAGGLGAIAIGTGFAVYSNSLETQSDTVCPNIKCGDQHALDLNKTARLDATIANIGWGLGGAALIGAGILWWVGGPQVVPVVDRDHAGVAFGGRF